MDHETEDQQRPPLHQRPAPSGPPARDGPLSTPNAPVQESPPTHIRMALSSIMSRLASRRLLTRRRLVATGIIVGVLAFMFGLGSPFSSRPAQTTPDTHTFPVSGRPTLIFKHLVANVNITPGPNGQVTITEMKNGETDEIQIHYAQQGDAITVTVDIPSGLMQDTWVDFNVKVPPRAGLTTTVATGTLETTDLGGPIVLNDTNGAIWATNLTGSVGLRTQSGSINLTNVHGQVAVVTQNGTITTAATRLEGGSSIQAGSGTINFHGSLSRTGTYQFQNSNGAVGITLPSSSAFLLIAHAGGGSITSDFHGVTVTQESGHTEARGTVGATSRARLIVQTSGGSIDLHQGK
jgi:hypothetical protein